MIQIDVIRDSEPPLSRTDIEVALIAFGLDYKKYELAEFDEVEWADSAATIFGGDADIDVEALAQELEEETGAVVEVMLYEDALR